MPNASNPPSPSTSSSLSASASFPPDIVQAGTPVLRSRAVEVPRERIASPELQALFVHMIDVMHQAPGVGLAAPQIGVGLRVIVLEDDERLMSKQSADERRERERVSFPTRVIVNPVLTPIGDARATFPEGCLSVRGYAGLVDRALEVEVTGLDERGNDVKWRVRGWPARILQHEVDHLEGTLYVDRMITRSFASADEAKKRWAGKPIAEILRDLGK